MARNTVATILRQARELLKTGWCQHQLHKRVKGVDCYCAQSALSIAATGALWRSYWEMEPLYALLESLVRRTDPSIDPLVTNALSAFNDTPGRTQAEVLALFDQAIREISTGG
jgi:hypothetical protein